jgi:hypothetical protein
MYRWYERARICYVFFSDFASGAQLDTAMPLCRWCMLLLFSASAILIVEVHTRMDSSELIAPSDVLFFNSKWVHVGTKTPIFDLLFRIMGIPETVLYRPLATRRVSVVAKMSWAAARQTTRVEDIA